MSSGVNLHVLYKVANAPINPFPFPHIYVRDVFPEDYYRELRAHLPPPEACKDLKALGRVGSGYPDTRLVLPVTPDDVQALAEPLRGFWHELAQWLLGENFSRAAQAKFRPYLDQRFGKSRNLEFLEEALIVQDYTTYSLGPHTDKLKKVLSLLFYLPADASLAHLGTSIYVPKQPDFQCQGGPHYSFELFDRVVTMPYLPNTLFAFPKTYNSFHGVEPITEGSVRRDLLLYDIYMRNPPELQQKPPAQETAAPTSKFSF